MPVRPLSVAVVLALAACTSVPQTTQTGPGPGHVPEIKPGVPAGYLGRGLPNSLALVPPPPAAGTPAFANDEAIHQAAQALRRTPREAVASGDADLAFPHVAGTFRCALGVSISQASTPRLYLLLQRTMVDAGLATYTAKDHYHRTRPFVQHGEDTCFQRDEASLRNDGSYPSGHTSIGWAWALVLTEVAPDRADALLERGRAFGESRLVCNAHWQSDVLAGRTVGAAAVAMLHANADFRADVVAAREEIAEARARGDVPTDCATEADALRLRITGAL